MAPACSSCYLRKIHLVAKLNDTFPFYRPRSDMFSQVSVSHSVHRGCVSQHAPWYRGCISQNALGQAVRGWGCEVGWWPSVVTFWCGHLVWPSFVALRSGLLVKVSWFPVWPSGMAFYSPPPRPWDGHWRGRYAPYWNVFLFMKSFRLHRQNLLTD